MKTLILLSRQDLDSLFLAEALRSRGEEVSIVLMQDSVYLALKDAEHSRIAGHAIKQGVKLHLLAEDVKKRGVGHQLMSSLELVDYDELVDLLFREDQRVINL